MDLKEFRDTLLRLDRPGEVLRLADTYLRQFEDMGDKFVLPKQYELIKPVLETYYHDLAGWVKFVRGVRDRLPVSGRKYHPEVQELYRTLEIRLMQQTRRERLDKAVAMAVRRKMIESTYDEKMRYARRCTQAWKVRRDNMLTVASKQTSKGRLSVEEREELLAEFWAGIDAEIDNGELPKP